MKSLIKLFNIDKEKINKLFIFLLVITLPLGSSIPYFTIGPICFYVFRIVCILSFIYLAATNQLVFKSGKIITYYFIFLITWLIYGLITMFWVIDYQHAFKDISYILWGTITSVVVISLVTKTKNSFQIISKTWILSFIILSFIAFIEIITTAHIYGSFSNAFTLLQGYFYDLFRSPITTFTNPNDYASFIIFTLPFLIINFKPYKLFLIIIAIVELYFIKSRLSYLSIIITTFILIYINLPYISHFFKRNRTKLIFYSSTFIFITTLIIVSNRYSKPIIEYKKRITLVSGSFNEIINKEYKNIGYDEVQSIIIQNNDTTSSLSIRKNLFKNGINYFISSYGMGIGAGQYTVYTKLKKGTYPTDRIIDPHNLVIEIISQYGFLIFTFILMIFWIIFKTIIIFIKKKSNINEYSFIVLAFPVYIIMSNSSSSFIPMVINWLFLSLIIYFTNEIQLKQEKI